MHEGLLRRLHVPLQRRNVTAYSALGDRTGQRQQQPPDPLRGQPRVVAQPLLDLLPPAVQTPDPLGRHAHRRCRPGYGPPDRLDVQLQPPGDFLLRHTLHQMQVADFGPLRHPDHLRVLPDSVDETTLSRRVGSSPGNPLFPRAQGVPFQVATGSLFMLPLPHCRGCGRERDERHRAGIRREAGVGMQPAEGSGQRRGADLVLALPRSSAWVALLACEANPSHAAGCGRTCGCIPAHAGAALSGAGLLA